MEIESKQPHLVRNDRFSNGAGTPLKRKVFVAVSGGVDSSVSLALLKERGYDVVGCFMKNWSQNMPGLECNWVGDREDALRVCATLGVPFRTVDLEKIYFKKVFTNFISEYKKGRTPNPDILCNSEVKFKAFLNFALTNGADAIATGHYSRLRREIRNPKSEIPNNKGSDIKNLKNLKSKSYKLLAARDSAKDQSYFLYRLGQKELSRAMFPVGGMPKPKVRELAQRFGLPTAAKPDSQGVCFVGEVALQQFLQNFIPEKQGKIMLLKDEVLPSLIRANKRIERSAHKEGVVGEHRGVWYYTIGQRHGLGVVGGGEPLYVAAKDVKKNILYVAPKDHPTLCAKELHLTDIHWVSGAVPKLPFTCKARIRYRQPLQSCTLTYAEKNSTQTFAEKLYPRPSALSSSAFVRVSFKEKQWAPASGQSVVFYDGAEVLGGGIIT